ncbi:OmpA family protein [Massilia sp. S19_KUP03_FR1]|uniref:OmpA family protein n=1 Tax=Massilia sp. S19_KUP03_FR1 TaxID=3025503 RepID=UPI002FCD5EF8
MNPAAAAEPQAAAAAATPAPFDFNTVPEAKGVIPPFPYVDTPPKINENWLKITILPMDEVDVILGKQVHRLEGRVAMRTFAHSHAEMSELEVRRNYQNALQSFGAVKVNVDQTGVHYYGDKRMDKLSPLAYDMSYDVYLARKGSARHWIVVMTSSSDTRLISIEETPFVQTIGYEGTPGTALAVSATGVPPAAPQPLDIGAMPVTTAPLPPFPYLPYPKQVMEGLRHSERANFDAVSFIVGKQLRTVEGKVEVRTFDNRDATMSAMAIRRNYEAAVKGLGAAKLNTVAPEDEALIAANGGAVALNAKLRFPSLNMAYDSYLLRTADKNIWIALMLADSSTRLVVVEEKAMQQSVTLVTADTMRTALAAKGHIPLYINFDTDKATLRADGKPAVDEIATLLKNDVKLKLSIEGHTDNSGIAAHNVDLSRQRANAVVQQLVASGIDAARLQAAGKGAATPLADNTSEAGRAQNRRVELVKL